MVDGFGIPGLTGYEEIGAGGFASVYLADEPEAGRQVAVKVLRAADEQARRRFDRERRTLGRTTEHPNIVTMFRSGFTEPGGHPYLVMEYLPGGSLQDRLDRQGPLPIDHAVELIVQVADALGFAHRAGILHKDVKPANILLTSTGAAKLGDFGISAVRDATGTSQMGFSLAYASPETFRASPGVDGRYADSRDERSDLFSLAATLYALVAGVAPFAADNQAAAMHRILTEPPAPTGSPELDRFFATALAKEPAARFPTAEHLIAALRSPSPGLGLGQPSAFVAGPGNGVDPSGRTAAVGGASPSTSPITGVDGRPTNILAAPPTDPPLPAPPTEPATASTAPGHPGPARGRRRSGRGPILAAAVAAALVAGGVAAFGWSNLVPGSDPDAAGQDADGATEALSSDEATASDARAADPGEDGDVDGEDATDETAADGADDDTTGDGEEEGGVLEVDPDGGADAGAAGSEDDTDGVAPADDTSDNDGSADPGADDAAADRALAAEPTVVAVLDPATRTNNVLELRSGLFASYHFQSGVRIWSRDDPSATVAATTNGAGALVELADGRLASGGSSGNRTVRIWDPADPGTTIATYRGHGNGDAVSALLQLTNGRIVSGTTGGEVHVWDPADPDITLARYEGHAFVIITDLVQLRNGLVLSNGEGDGAHVWNPSNPGSTAATYAVSGGGAGGYTYDVVELDNGLLVTDTLSGTIRIWDPNDPGGPVGFYRGHGDNVGGLAALPGGLVASGGPNGEVHIWDSTAPDRALQTYSGHIGRVFSVTRLDGGVIASTASDQVHLWDPYVAGG